jgi:hypothetical protein
MTRGALVIQVSQLPPRINSPNARAFWAAKYKENVDSRGYATAVYLECVDFRNRLEESAKHPFKPYHCYHVQLTFVFAQKRRRDPDNFVAAFKPAMDKIVDAGLIVDDSSEHIYFSAPKFEVDKERAPLTIITLTGDYDG